MSNGQNKELKEEFSEKTNDSKTKIWKIYYFYLQSRDDSTFCSDPKKSISIYLRWLGLCACLFPTLLRLNIVC